MSDDARPTIEEAAAELQEELERHHARVSRGYRVGDIQISVRASHLRTLLESRASMTARAEEAADGRPCSADVAILYALSLDDQGDGVAFLKDWSEGAWNDWLDEGLAAFVSKNNGAE